MQSQDMWEFRTRNFRVVWEISDCFDLDLSFDESGETREKIASGDWIAFDSKIYVEWNGQEIGAAYLGQSIYEKPEEFRDHIGRNAIPLADKAKREFCKAKQEFRNRIAYCQEKRGNGEWSKAHYFRSSQSAREAIRQARAEYIHRMQCANAGGYGSYFSDMVREAIGEARDHMRALKLPHIRAA